MFSSGKQSTNHTLAAAVFAIGLGTIVTHAATPTLTAQDVGYPTLAGSTTTAAGKTTIVGGGNDIWGTADNFHYAFFKVTGDFDYIVNVEDLQGPDNWTKAMLMARLDDGSGVPQGGDPHLSNMATRSGGQNQLGPQWRVSRDGASDWRSPTGTPRPSYPNTWLRMERSGSVFYLYYGTDGKTWTQYAPTLFDTAGSSPPGADNATSFTQAWPNTILFGLAVTAHNDGDTTGGKAVFSNFGAHVAVPIAITTQPPATLLLSENKTLTLSVAATGDPLHYQWRKNGSPIPGATSASYSVAIAKTSDSGTYTVRLYGAGTEVISGNSVVTVTQDTEAPKLASAVPDELFTSVVVTYSEPVNATAENKANYSLDKGVTVSSVSRIDQFKVKLTTSKMAEGADYTLTVTGVQDTATPPNTIAAGATISYKSYVFAAGFMLHKFWDNITQNNIAGLTGNSRFPDAPTFVTIEPRWEYGPNGSNESGSNYGNQLIGWFTPAKSGNYVFFTNSDDPSNFYLSTDDNPANKKLIAQESGWSNARQWVGVGGGSTLEDKRSDSFASTEWPNGPTISLVAGRRYYMESLHTEGGGGDSVGATFIVAGETDPANGDAPKLTGSLIGTYLNPNGASVNVVQQPADATAQAGRTATFSASASGVSAYGKSVNYQWQKANPGSSTFADITGATKSTYTTPILALTDAGAKFRVVATVPTLSVNSAAATVNVVPDTFAPVVTKVGSVLKGSNIEIGVGFDEALDDASAGTAANYALSKGTVSKVRVEKYDTPRDPTAPVTTAGAVVLETTGLAKGDTVTVTVKNVKDTLGNGIAAAGVSKSLTVTSKMSWVAVGGNEYQEGATPAGWDQTAANYYDDLVALGNDKDFDLISGGSANWNNYDEATFVFEQVTGDFDRVARVEYQDPSSQWARAGIMVRKTLDENVARAQVDGGYTMSQAMIVRVNPTVQWNGTGGNNAYEWIWRDTDGGNYSNSGGGGIPAYPNAWLRIQRTGQTFTGYRSSDGVTWANIGTHTFPSDTPLPSALYVGPYFAPELTNNDSWKIGHSVVAKFRDYAPFTAVQPAPTLSIVRTATGITFTFEGTLQAADSVLGPWADVTGGSPQTVITSGAMKFYRAKR